VDSTKNTEDVSKFEGALKLGQGMNWNWNAGFIFVKTEGEVTSASVTSPVSFKYHIGLFGKNGQPNNTRTVTLASQSASESKARVSASISPAFHIVVDVLGKFNAPNIIEVTKKPVVMVDNASNIIADNYAQGMFTLDHIHN
jgi:hypothetical protein